jgi:hypothetical protein
MLCFYVPVVSVWRVSCEYSDSIRFVNNPIILPSYNSKLESTYGEQWQRILEEASATDYHHDESTTIFIIPRVSLRQNQAPCLFT